jgi:hypothetical protein
MTITQTTPRAKLTPTPILSAPEESTTSPTASATPEPILNAPSGNQTGPATMVGAAPGGVSSPGHQTPPPARSSAEPLAGPRAGATDSRGRTRTDNQWPCAPAQLDPVLLILADALDDLERTRIANENRLRHLTRSAEDKDGEVRGLGLDERVPQVAQLTAIVDDLRKIEHRATLNLNRQMRKHPLGPWVKATKGVGEKQAARLLAAIGDPYIRPEIVREDGTVEPSRPRRVSDLWAYCGLHVLPAGSQQDDGALGPFAASGSKTGDLGHRPTDLQTRSAGVAARPRRRKGQRVNWNTTAKTRAHLIAKSCMKQLEKTCPKDEQTGRAQHIQSCGCSPYRLKYDARRARTAVTRPEWTPGHSHNDALGVAAKEVLKDLWREAKRLSEQQNPA